MSGPGIGSAALGKEEFVYVQERKEGGRSCNCDDSPGDAYRRTEGERGSRCHGVSQAGTGVGNRTATSGCVYSVEQGGGRSRGASFADWPAAPRAAGSESSRPKRIRGFRSRRRCSSETRAPMRQRPRSSSRCSTNWRILFRPTSVRSVDDECRASHRGAGRHA